ncbi:hypothetical protein [Paenibacillus sp. J2TS4]|uniref:hypothetical protein n=1 Tax=Paenibacillus sp. J2TS4 TaxID=2807194 RepID=UPI0035B53887
MRGLEKVHTEFGIVALAHNLLKVAGIRLAAFLQKQRRKKVGRKTCLFSAQLFILGTYWTAPFFRIYTLSDGRKALWIMRHSPFWLISP